MPVISLGTEASPRPNPSVVSPIAATNKARVIPPRPVLPQYIWPAPGTINDRRNASPALLCAGVAFSSNARGDWSSPRDTVHLHGDLRPTILPHIRQSDLAPLAAEHTRTRRIVLRWKKSPALSLQKTERQGRGTLKSDTPGP